jgi:hypothetical protein
LRKIKSGHEWYEPAYKSPLFPLTQIWGIVGGAGLLIVMGEKAFIGALAAVILGTTLYYFYGRIHTNSRTTPFQTFRKEFVNPSQSEHERRELAFHASDLGGKNHLTLREFQSAIHALKFSYTDEECRDIFHHVDTDENGVIDIDEFLDHFE